MHSSAISSKISSPDFPESTKGKRTPKAAAVSLKDLQDFLIWSRANQFLVSQIKVGEIALVVTDLRSLEQAGISKEPDKEEDYPRTDLERAVAKRMKPGR